MYVLPASAGDHHPVVHALVVSGLVGSRRRSELSASDSLPCGGPGVRNPWGESPQAFDCRKNSLHDKTPYRCDVDFTLQMAGVDARLSGPLRKVEYGYLSH